MIQLKKLTLRNWCQHRHREIEFGTVTSILGPIGSGKSNILNALCFALTGDIRNEGVKKDNVCQLAESGDPADVLLEFRAGGSACEIRRAVRSASVRLKIGDECHESSASVNDKLRSMLSLDSELIQSYVFVSQWQMFGFLDYTDAVRSRTFAKLFGLEKAEVLYNLLGKYRLPEAKKTYDLETTRNLLGAAVDAIRQAQLDLASASAEVATPSQIESAKLTVRQSDQAAWLMSQREPLLATFHSLNQQYAQLLEKGPGLDAVVAALSVESDSLKREITVFDAELAASRSMDEAVKVRSARLAELGELTVQVQEATDRLAAAPQPDLDADVLAREDRIRQLMDLAAVLSHDVSRLSSLVAAASGGSSCPTCGAAIAGDPAADLAAARRRRNDIDASISELQAKRGANEMKLRLVAELQNRRGDAQKRLDLVAASLASFKHLADASVLRGSQEIVAELSDRRHKLGQVSTAIESAKREQKMYEAAISKIQALASRLEENAAAMRALPQISADQREAAVQFERKQLELSVRISNLNALIERESGLRLRLEEHVRIAMTELEQADKIALATARLGELRGVFHQSGAPAIFSRDAMASMVEDINAYLLDAEAGFFVSSIGELDSKSPMVFRLRFRSGVEISAKRLSGGQKVLLAVCFRLAMHKRFSSDLGLLVMDEPTAGLNKGNIDRVGQLFSKIRAGGASSGLQLVFVTHDAGLSRFCDKIVDLT